MPLLQFMPWCPIDRAYSVGEITILPFRWQERLAGIADLEWLQIKTILASYRDLQGHPVRKAALIRYSEKPILADLAENEIDVTFELIDIACFCGLARREFFNPVGRYCNADSFIHYGQGFSADLTHVGITSRRRERRTFNVRSLDRTIFSIPISTEVLREVTLDESLFRALVAYRQSAPASMWARWQSAISCFNQANTDDSRFRDQIEWVLLCGAFEHLLDARSDADDVAQKFAEAVVPTEQKPAHESGRRSAQWKKSGVPLRCEWMREFYRVRGDFAHGRLQTQQPMQWKPLEHIVLAAIAFPLVVRCLLAKAGHYSLLEDDRIQIEAFEALADVSFLEEPPNSGGSMDSWWSRVCNDARWKIAGSRFAQDLQAQSLNDNENDE